MVRHRRFATALLLFTITIADCGAAPNGTLRVTETEASITIADGEKTVLVYNKQSPPVPDDVEPVYARSGFLHPVKTPSGRTITAVFPRDHKHQNGIFSAWVNTNWNGRKVDFWNVAKQTGRVVHDRVISVRNDVASPGFVVDLIHQAVGKTPANVLRERWEITAFDTDGDHRCFDLRTTQTALTDKPLTVNKYRYGGVALRGPADWVLAAKQNEADSNTTQAASGFLNDHGSNRIDGNHQKARWVSLYGSIDGQPVSISVLSHPQNFRAPQTARLHPTKPYFCFAPCVDGDFVIDQQHPYQAHYRYLITDTAPDQKWLNDQWTAWTQSDSR